MSSVLPHGNSFPTRNPAPGRPPGCLRGAGRGTEAAAGEQALPPAASTVRVLKGKGNTEISFIYLLFKT